MNTSHIKTVEKYYQAMLSHDFETMAGFLDEDIKLVSPLAEVIGKAEVIDAAKRFAQMVQRFDIESKFGEENEVMLAYTFQFPEPIGKLRAAGLFKFKADLICSIDLYYDGRPFETLMNEIFS